MNKDNVNLTRRTLLRTGVVSIPALTLFSFSARAELPDTELPKLELEDPTAQALGYVHDASTVDPETRGGEDRTCTTCQLYTEPEAEWGPCALYPGKAVAAEGWCKGWVKRA